MKGSPNNNYYWGMAAVVMSLIGLIAFSSKLEYKPYKKTSTPVHDMMIQPLSGPAPAGLSFIIDHENGMICYREVSFYRESVALDCHLWAGKKEPISHIPLAPPTI